MRVLIIGGGGRENAIAWKVSQSNLLTSLFCAPGNPGTSGIARNLEIDLKDFNSIKDAVTTHKIGMVIVGPEEPLVEGLRDFFENDSQLKHVMFVGPGKEGAQLEGSKDFAKEFMKRHSIPTAAYKTFTANEMDNARKFLATLSPPFVLKADGLAAGKGVIIPDNIDDARIAVDQILGGKFGSAGNKVVIEEFLHGIELSVFVLTNGKEYMILPEAKDYKRIWDGDKGPNTGGMGAVSPVPFAGKEFLDKVEKRIVKPTLEGLSKDGISYKGFIFIGLMNCGGDPYVIEYNVRMGDPETEAVMPRIKSDLLSHLIAMENGVLSNEILEIDSQTAVTLVMVSEGYPGDYKKGIPVDLSKLTGDTLLFHSGTKEKDGKLVTSGGRVLALTHVGTCINECREKLYKTVANIGFDGCSYRKDLGLDLN
ncbi:MAG: phosphoribosylamine--glycine ligase [Rikenellaceae bacterium]|nr:phosphoribosylamine--glycine ligase [Rikenellaceae bacterium]